MEAKKKFFMDCHLAGRKYHDADEVWDKLKVGTLLQLERDLDNRYDPDAVASGNTLERAAMAVFNMPWWTIHSALVTFPVPTMRPSPLSSKWDGMMPSSAASARSMRMLTRSTRFT